jgi:hypothetical protein
MLKYLRAAALYIFIGRGGARDLAGWHAGLYRWLRHR